LPPLIIEDDYIEARRAEMEATPQQMRKHFSEVYQLSDYDVGLLTEEKETAFYFKTLCEKVDKPKSAANWMNGAIRGLTNELGVGIGDLGISSERLAGLINLAEEGKVSAKVATQSVLPLMLKSTLSALEIAEREDLLTEGDSDSIDELINDVLLSLPKEVEAYRAGKKKLIGLFMGEVMKKSRGKANPKVLQQKLNEKLNQ